MKKFYLALTVLAIVSVGLSVTTMPAAAKIGAKVLSTKKVKRTAYHATKGTIYKTNKLTKVVHHAKNHKYTTLYVTKQSTVRKANHKKTVYSYISTKKARGWILRSYLKKGVAPKKSTKTGVRTTASTFNAQAASSDFLAMVNKERAKQGATPLTIVTDLTNLANQRAADCAELGDITHYDSAGNVFYLQEGPTFGINFDEGLSSECLYMADEGFVDDYQKAGTNAADQYLYHDAESNWGHRDNLIDPEAKTIGIGWKISNGTIYNAIDQQG
ncbi:CAP domain-containing protein [Levilactobacillus tongjiangensis]|uniref:CAP domain-containing protein n=1 Tax=Levilactobacillus tongjiangensis TaxID=2486023 RepID=A0ABW1SUJ0_9LACO|nr:CAP domain-containing protein [Levilactobacillus tongjiangensis]